MTSSKSLSNEAIEEFESRVSNDLDIPEGLRKQIVTLISDGKWKSETSVSSALEAFHSISQGGSNDQA